jgi:hypothetical protein
VRKNFKTVTFLVAASALAFTACVKSEDKPAQFKMPNFELPKEYQDVMRAIEAAKTCKTADSEIPEFEEASKNTIQISDQVDLQDVQYVSCNGEVDTKDHRVVKDLSEIVTVAPDSEFGSELTKASISNLSTCSEKMTSDAKDYADTIELPDGDGSKTTKPLPVLTPRISPKGELKISLTQSDIRIGVKLNVREGNNVLVIKYLGECLEHKEAQDKNSEPECLKYKELGHKSVLLQVSIKKNELPGTKKENVCSEKSNSQEKAQ